LEVKDQAKDDDQEGERQEVDITETRQQIQRCEFKDELWFIAGFEEKDEDEFYKEVD